MTYERGLLLLAVGVAGIAGWFGLHAYDNAHASVAAPSVATPPFFTRGEIGTFLAAASSAEAIADPLKRCLAFPDPPGSHWSPSVVEAYCRYHSQAFVTLAEAQDLIGRGNAAGLDHRLAAAEHAQLAQEGSAGLLDHTYHQDFGGSSPELRASLDAWKLQSPQSAFAYAASGVVYVNAAREARGGAWIQDTPKEKIAAMEDLLAKARSDLDKAVSLDPGVTPAYSSMLDVAQLEGDEGYAASATRQGLKADPANYSLYAMLMQGAEPKWGGSLPTMVSLASAARAQSSKNPLLLLIQPEVPAMEAGLDNCGCHAPEDIGAYRRVLDQVASISLLNGAGEDAIKGDLPAQFAVVYLSEALRFDPVVSSARKTLIEQLLVLSEQPGFKAAAVHLALIHADRWVDLAAHDSASYGARGSVRMAMNDYAHAEADYSNAFALAPDDAWAGTQLGQFYAESTHEWDKAWNVAEKMIKTHPEVPNGWILRASIQSQQPRPGLRDTDAYIVAHFANSPDVEDAVAQARRDLASDASGR
ncbi:MAG TPA: hypothetical protein VGH80_02445 [Xanthomonadaceae bacterium]